MVGYHLDDLHTLFLLFIKKKKKLDSMFFTGVFCEQDVCNSLCVKLLTPKLSWSECETSVDVSKILRKVF